jgi:adenosylcobinamide-phosphate synthase
LKIFLRDRFNHSSPNSAHGESAFAGALAVQLGGPTRYQGRLKDHPYIGDAVEPLMPVHIIKANRLMYTAAFTFLAILVIARILITGELI